MSNLIDMVNQEIQELIEDDNFNYKLDFKAPDDLLKSFELLEEKNLFLIQQTQEAEQAIEDKNQEFKQVKHRLNREIEKVSRDFKDLQDKIEATQLEIESVNAIKDNITSMSPRHMENIKNKIKQIVINTIDKPGSRILETTNTENALHMLAEIEKQC